jgi:hypothetical protein
VGKLKSPHLVGGEEGDCASSVDHLPSCVLGSAFSPPPSSLATMAPPSIYNDKRQCGKDQSVTVLLAVGGSFNEPGTGFACKDHSVERESQQEAILLTC